MVTVVPGRPRHPEKSERPVQPSAPRPAWIRVRAVSSVEIEKTRAIVRSEGLKTVCEEASCPNLAECWQKSHATFLIMGDVCTRACAFCNVATGLPGALDASEPGKIARAVSALGLAHVVITSVDRDDLDDGGAAHFASVVAAVREKNPNTTIEILTPDFLKKPGSIEVMARARPDVFNHNIETVPRLYPTIRPGARYFQSLRLLARVKEVDAGSVTKSGLMLGLGEAREEILQVLDDLRVADVDALTLGQYLQPTPRHAPVIKYYAPEEFEALAQIAKAKGFALVSASPLTRSSYHAADDFDKLRAARRAAK